MNLKKPRYGVCPILIVASWATAHTLPVLLRVIENDHFGRYFDIGYLPFVSLNNNHVKYRSVSTLIHLICNCCSYQQMIQKGK